MVSMHIQILCDYMPLEFRKIKLSQFSTGSLLQTNLVTECMLSVVSKQYSKIHNQLTPSLLYMGLNFNVQHSFNCVNISPMVSFSCLSVLAWHDHMKVISHISFTNIFNFDIDSDKKLVLNANET